MVALARVYTAVVPPRRSPGERRCSSVRPSADFGGPEPATATTQSGQQPRGSATTGLLAHHRGGSAWSWRATATAAPKPASACARRSPRKEKKKQRKKKKKKDERSSLQACRRLRPPPSETAEPFLPSVGASAPASIVPLGRKPPPLVARLPVRPDVDQHGHPGAREQLGHLARRGGGAVPELQHISPRSYAVPSVSPGRRALPRGLPRCDESTAQVRWPPRLRAARGRPGGGTRAPP